MTYAALSGVRIVDLTHLIAGPYATRLLAALGAEVIKVEPPWGEPGRKVGANLAREASPGDRGPLFAFLNTDKRGVTIDLRRDRGRELLRAMLADADLLFENFAPGTLARLGLDPQALLGEFSQLSIVSISNFGQDGPDRDAKLNDLVLMARGGWTYTIGEPDREPLTPPGSLGQYVGALYAAIGALRAVWATRLGGRGGQHVDVSLLESTVATMIYDTVTFQYTGLVRERMGKRFARGPFMIATLKCRDGYAGLHCVTDAQYAALCEMMGRPELIGDERFSSTLRRYEHNEELLAIVEQFFAGRDAEDLYREGQRRAIPIAKVPTMAEVLAWEQLNSRDYFETIGDPALGSIRIPGPPLRLSSHARMPSRPAPRLGEHNRDVFCGRLGLSERALGELRAEGVV
jgi:CoA:oxalate CoA-transferase